MPKITASIHKRKEGYCYEAPWMIGGRMGKSFILTRNGFLLHLPVKYCPVRLVDDDNVEVEVPHWLYQKNLSFFS
ncbi:hypothetical protein C8N40_11167 [Pontibacter mucosus]|uniref:Uncharacterized protein n=1 Tax=Pontibacter mucosus TaxID=1649266 RepID=A0A2T5YD04_9BACT|nr:hypothetical protein [Pontibacter mucosus]PTX14402.1 hypothetical protein C8N40_11167 [Pontibacter mucosus]